MRQELSLAGSWQFQLDPDGTARVDTLYPDRQITVPLPWQAAFPELESYSGYAWYQREFELQDEWLCGAIILNFGAVDYWCEVFVNGQPVGSHEGGYTPFAFAIQSYARAGTNQLTVRVYDAAQSGHVETRWLGKEKIRSGPPFDPVQIPHGKQDWYLNAGGIWQDVTLSAMPAIYLEHVRVTPDVNSGRAILTVQVAGNVEESVGSIRAVVGEQAVEVPLAPGQSTYELSITVPDTQPWTPETPSLYRASVGLATYYGEDAASIRFGFREIEIRDGVLLLNGQPIFLRAALDQDMYPETIYTVPSEAFLRDEFRKAKELGLNCLRCHIKPPDPLYLDVADEMGLLVWAEIPSWRTFYLKTTVHPDHFNNDDFTRDRVQRTLVDMVGRDCNHPSLVIWTIVNEDWGTALALSSSDRAWVAEMYDLCKQLDPTRLVVDNSACLNSWGPNIHVKSDLDDFHVYATIPDSSAFFSDFIEQFSLRPTWTYSSQGDAARSGHEPLILSEFGNWGLPSVARLSDSRGNPPDWFKLGPWWSGWEGEPGWPKGVLERFHRLGLDQIWPDYETFAQASQWHQYQAMKYEIEVMRRQPALKGYVITELSDIYWESNGLLDFNRGTKAYHQAFHTINAPDVIVPLPNRYATWDDQPFPFELFASHYGDADWSGTYLQWTTDDQTGEQPIPALHRGEVAALGQFEAQFAKANRARTTSIQLAIKRSKDAVLAQNELPVLVIPASARQASYGGPLAVQDGNPSTESTLAQLSYQITADLAGGTILVSSAPTVETLRWVREGGKLFYMCQGISPFFWAQGRGGAYGGHWITSYNWLKPEFYPRLAISNPLTMPFNIVAPTRAITGLPVENAAYHDDFLAGQFTGWVQHPAIHTVQFRYGKGIVLMTTFNLFAGFQGKSADPVAVALFHDLLDHLASDRCQPRLATNL